MLQDQKGVLYSYETEVFMANEKPKAPDKDAVQKLRELYEKLRGKPSPELLEILKQQPKKEEKDKQSACLSALC